MKLEVARKKTDHLIPTPIVQQTAFWGRVHRRLGFGTDAFDLTLRPSGGSSDAAPLDTKRGDFLVVRSPLSADLDCAYVPFGPELSPHNDDVGGFLEQLSRSLQPMLGPRCAFIRWDLPWTSLHARESRDFNDCGEWVGPPANHLRELRLNFGTEFRNLRKAPRDLLPPSTLLVDLQGTEDDLLARMHPKTRYNIRLAERRGVVVTRGTAADLPSWYALYLETTARNHLEPMPLVHFETMLAEHAEGSNSPVQPRLLLARHEGQILAGMLLAMAPARATYLYGASSVQHRELMASSALQWAAIRVAKSAGCADYDMFGAAPRNGDPHPLAGVHRFKVGFGGRLVHREGCWDFPFEEESYESWRRWEEAQVQRRGINPG